MTDKEKAVETTVLVRRQFNKAKETEGPIDEKDETIAIHRFETEPAKVSFEIGVTMNLGNYESARISVGVAVPCYREEMDQAFEFARKFAEGVIAKEKTDIQKSRKEMF